MSVKALTLIKEAQFLYLDCQTGGQLAVNYVTAYNMCTYLKKAHA